MNDEINNAGNKMSYLIKNPGKNMKQTEIVNLTDKN